MLTALICIAIFATSFLVALILGAILKDSDAFQDEFFGTDNHRWADTAPANSHNWSNLVNVPNRDVA